MTSSRKMINLSHYAITAHLKIDKHIVQHINISMRYYKILHIQINAWLPNHILHKSQVATMVELIYAI